MFATYRGWAEGLDSGTAARGWLAIGIAAASHPGPPTWTDQQQVVDALRHALESHTSANVERAWSSQLPCPWTDPSALEAWDPDAVPPADAWARAWDELGEPVLRLALTVSPRSDLLRLTETLRSVPGIYSTFVTTTSARPVSWRFPLRVGFPATDRGRALHDELRSGFEGSSWRAALIDPVLVDRTRVSCDLLVLEGEPEEVPTVLASVPEVRAGAVVVARPGGGLTSPTLPVVDDVIELTGAWAVGFVETPDLPEWVVRLVEELSHAQPLDLAFDAAPGQRRVLVADPDVVVAETAAQRARRVAGWLRAIPEPLEAAEGHSGAAPEQDELVAELTRVAEEGTFLNEDGDASDLSRFETAVAEVLDRAGAARHLQARIAAAAVPDLALPHFRPATEHTIEVHVGSTRWEGWLTATTPFPEEALTPDRPHRLTVVLTEPELLPQPLLEHVDLPVVGDSTTARFSLTTNADTESVDARIIVLAGNRVLQTVRLPSRVGPDETGPDEAGPGNAPPDAAVPELVVAAATGALGDRPAFAASFLVNHDAAGVSRATAMTHDTAAMVKLDSEAVTNAVRKVSQRLTAIVDNPADFEALDAPASVELLVALAFHGGKLRNALVADSPGLDEVTSGSGAIQVVPGKPDAYFPFEFAYDFAVPRPGAGLCPGAMATLSDPDPAATCPEPHSPDVVCPLGFWALHHVIERHAFQPATDLPADFALRSTPRLRDQVIRVGPTLFAASNRVDKVVPGSTATVTTALATAGPHVPVDAWPAWGDAVRQQPPPAALLLLAHTVHNSSLDAYGLEIGADSAAYDFTGLVPPGPSLVMLLGCETAVAGNVSYERFPAEFRIAGAKVVIATLTEVLGRHAAPIAATLVSEIHRQCGERPCGMGEVMLVLRRRLLAQGLLPVLALTCFGDADWMLGP